MNMLKAKMAAASSKVASKMSKSLAKAGQSLKRTVGSAAKSEDPHTQQIIDEFKATKHSIKDVQLAAQIVLASRKQFLEAEAKFQDVLERFAQDPDLNQTEAQRLVDNERAILQTKQGMTDKFEELVCLSVKDVLDTEIKEARDLILKYDSLHTDYDVLTAKVEREAGGPRAAELQNELASTTREYEEVKKDVAHACAVVKARKHDVLKNMQAFVTAQSEVFTDKAMGGYVPSVSAVAKSVVAAPSPASTPSSAPVSAAVAAPPPQPVSAPPPAQEDTSNIVLPELQTGTTVTAQFDYDAQSADELTFSAGDKIRVDSKGDEADDGWWQGTVVESAVPDHINRSGMFPSNYTA